jgi:methionyl-tRNA synthetase
LTHGRLVVTCALPYANGEIHLGHLVSTYLPADIFVRFSRLSGAEVVFICATDDFGTPILIAAEQENKSPREFVAFWNQRDLMDFKDLAINFDIFDRTSSLENIQLAQHFFSQLYAKGHIYEREVSQSYCSHCRQFLPDRYVRGTCPYCGAADQYSDSCEKCGKVFQPGEVRDPVCAICGSKPETKSSQHFFFRLSAFTEPVRNWLQENSNLQPEVRNYVLNWIKEGLQDWDITRDIAWGVPIPRDDAKGKVLYLWFDNHLCYISSTLKLLKKKGIDGRAFWNDSTIFHFIGKDIVYHHYLFLPAMRIGVGEYKLPEFIPTRGHLLLQGEKFSKSRGWYVGLREFLNAFPPDYLRYYLAAITPYSQSDVNFGWKEFQGRINNELVANIGNFVHRTLTFLWSRFGGKVPKPNEFSEIDQEFENRIKGLAEQVGKMLSLTESDKALKRILEFSDYCNQYFQKKQPWVDGKNAVNCLYLGVNAVRSLAILLEPFLPDSAETLWQMLGLEGSVHVQDWQSISVLQVVPNHEIKKPQILFKKIEDSEIEKQLVKLKPHSS